jgi:hypothetical protein
MRARNEGQDTGTCGTGARRPPSRPTAFFRTVIQRIQLFLVSGATQVGALDSVDRMVPVFEGTVYGRPRRP